MKSQKEIKQKIGTVNSIRKVTKAMETIANIRLQKALRDMAEGSIYSQELDKFIRKVAGESKDVMSGIPFAVRRPVKSRLFIVVASDKGLCGFFNSHLLMKVSSSLLEEVSEGGKVSVITVGKKASDMMSLRGFDVLKNYQTVPSGQMRALSQKISSRCIGLFMSGQADSVVLFYNHYLSMVKQEVTASELLPVVFDNAPLPDHIPVKCDAIFGETGYEYELPEYIYVPGKKELLVPLLRHYIENKVLNILLESSAGENSSRVVAMQQATVNADEMIADLTLQYNKARQEIITSQIIEITSSADALN